jgi:hypothetical protein
VSELVEARVALAQLLDGVIEGATSFSEFPEAVIPPFIAVGPGDPYLDFGAEGVTFGRVRVNLAASFVADVGTNDVRAAELDSAVLAMVQVLEESEAFIVTRVDQPGQIGVNGLAHLGVSVIVATEIGL